MPSKLFKFIWKLHPIVLGIFFMVTPLFFMVFFSIVSFIAIILEKPEPNQNLMGIGILIVMAIYLVWSKNVSVFFNEKMVKPSPISTEWYMRSYWYLIAYLFLETITKTPLGYLETEITPALYVLIYIIVTISRLLAFLAFIHTNLFTAQVVWSIEKGKRVTMGESLSYATYMWVFPIGIPLLQHKLKKKPKVTRTSAK